MDYTKLIDAQIWAFINDTARYYPPDAIDLSIDQQRQTYDKMCREFFQNYPPGVEAQDRLADNVPVRCYRSKPDAQAVVLYTHGGGFIVGGLDSHDDVCAEICDQTGFDVVSVDYRLCPEHAHPAAYQDCLTAFRWAQQYFGKPVILAGDSGGGNLAAAVAHATRHNDPAKGMVLIYPGLGGDMSKGSYQTHKYAPMLTLADVEFYSNLRGGDADNAGDYSYAPLWDDDFANLPPTMVFSAQCDPLCDDGDAYCAKINAAGGRAEWVSETGLVHGYLRARHSVSRAQSSFESIIQAILGFGA